jgi:ABC-type amino acid transport substrate-binding protein
MPLKPRTPQRAARLLTAVAAGLWAAASVAQPLPVKVCLPDIDAPPFLHRDTSRPGIFNRLLIDAGREAGLQVTILRLPSARCRLALNTGEADAMTLPAVPAYLDELDFPLNPQGQPDVAARLGRLQFLLLRRRGEAALDWDGVRLSKPGLVVGIRRGVTTLVDRLHGLGVTVDDQAFAVDQLLAKLQARRIDLAAMSREEFAAAKPSGIEALGQPLISTDLHLATGRRLASPLRERIAAWREQIARLRDLPAYRE